MGTKLTDADFKEAADLIGVDVATIHAVTDVESRGGGYDDKERLIARFEGHKFRKFTNNKFDASNPNVSYPYSRQNLKAKPHGYSAFSEAFALDPHAAMVSTSWGMFQPMGEYFGECGFDSVDDMVTAYRESEGAQLKGFIKQVKARGLVDKLKRRDWAGFAKNYNGADYAVNAYDKKLSQAYARHSK